MMSLPKNLAAHVLLVDDEPHILDVLVYSLEQNGFTTRRCLDGEEAWTAFCRDRPDVSVLDLNLPGLGGLELFRRMRAEDAETPVIMLTSLTDEVDRVLGLEMGADDYITKPFSPREVVARVRAVLRRSRRIPDPQAPLRAGNLAVFPEACTARWNGRDFRLTGPECRLLARLVRHPARVFSREELIRELHGEAHPVTDRSIDAGVNRLRRKFREIDPDADPIEAVYGIGYKLRHPDRESPAP